MKLLKGIARILGKLFGGLWRIFDKIIITPISRVVYYLYERISGLNINFDKSFSSKNSIIVLSLICALCAFFAVYKDSGTLADTEATVLGKQKVEAIYNEEVYVVEGIPDTVDITLMGRKSNLYLAKQLANHTVTLDLSGLGEGTHKVKLKYNNPIQSLDYKLDPSKVTVYIYPKVSEVKTLATDIINSDKLNDKLTVSDISLNREEVIVKGSEKTLKTISNVKALIDLSTIKEDKPGTYTLDKVKLVAYDDNGKEIKNIEIVPGTVSATIVLTSPSKEVPLKVVPKGEVKSGSAIETIETDVKKVTVYGEESVLNKINYVPVEIDVNNLNKDKTFKVRISKPSGVRSVSETNVTIKVKIQSETSKTFEDVPIEFENLGSKYTALAGSQADTKVSVLVKGTSTVLNGLSKDDIKAYVDLSEYTEGTWNVPVKATGTDLKLVYTPKVKTINLIIKKK